RTASEHLGPEAVRRPELPQRGIRDRELLVRCRRKRQVRVSCEEGPAGDEIDGDRARRSRRIPRNRERVREARRQWEGRCTAARCEQQRKADEGEGPAHSAHCDPGCGGVGLSPEQDGTRGPCPRRPWTEESSVPRRMTDLYDQISRLLSAPTRDLEAIERT